MTAILELPRHPHETKSKTLYCGLPPAFCGSETILVVEDEPSIRTLTKRLLERLGYVVVTAASPGEALRLAQAHDGMIDLLLTDVVMPEMNGRDLAQCLLSVFPGMKQVFMSGYTLDVMLRDGVVGEDAHFIQKPFTVAGLVAKVRAVLDGPRVTV